MATGDQLLSLAGRHVGEAYVLGASVPKDNSKYKGPWDCAEFASWLVFQVSARLYGCVNDMAQPAAADAFSGSWSHDSRTLGRRVAVAEAAVTPGAMVLRAPNSAGIKIGHIVVSDGRGGTVEAHSRAKGVIAGSLAGRVWDCGVLVPWIDYTQLAAPATAPAAVLPVLRLTEPLTRGAGVRAVQRMLKQLGFSPGAIDGSYGHATVAAVHAFQIAKGLVVDGEVGPATRKALERALA